MLIESSKQKRVVNKELNTSNLFDGNIPKRNGIQIRKLLNFFSRSILIMLIFY